MIQRLSALLFLGFLLFSCKKKEQKAPAPEGGTYFSITQFADDQFRTYWGQPFTLVRTVWQQGRTDSAYVAAKDVDWAKVLEPFFKADISDPKFLGRYNFSVLNDDVTVSKTYYYEAKEEDLFTRSFQIITDPFTDKVKNIYIETRKGGEVQKLYYTPLKLIQVQQFDKTLLGQEQNLRVEYRFLY
jgi:hypothetical protein